MTASTTSPTLPTSPPAPRSSVRRALLTWLYRRSRLQLILFLVPPIAFLGLIYLGSLTVLFLTSLWHVDGRIVVRDLSLINFQTIFDPSKPYIGVTLHTLGMAVAVTITDAVLAFPLAYYMARVASPRTRNLLFIAVLMPLWVSYLVRVYSWRLILAEEGPLSWLLGFFGLSGPGAIGDGPIWIVFTYIWLPFMILPVFAGLERIPDSLLEASADLGGRGWTTLRRVVLPLALPALAAGSIFTFSLTLGDYITPTLFSGSQFIGNVVYSHVGVAGDYPFAAAMAVVPVVIVGVYLLIVRRLGAFDAL
jgi:putative spermidine/putrescine transport system permease protein